LEGSPGLLGGRGGGGRKCPEGLAGKEALTASDTEIGKLTRGEESQVRCSKPAERTAKTTRDMEK